VTGHIRLGPYNDIRSYMLLQNPGPLPIARSNANQLATKLGQGAGDYSDLTSWTAFAQDDWQAGVGKRDPDAGGFLFAEAETRWANKLQLGNALVAAVQSDPTNYPLNTDCAPGVLKAESSVAVGTTQAIKRIAKGFEGNGTKLSGVHICLQNDDTLTSVSIQIHTLTAGNPDVELELVTEVLDDTIGPGNHYIPLDENTVDGNLYSISIYPTVAGETMNLPIDTSSDDPASDGYIYYTGSGWLTYTGGRPLLEPVMGMPPSTEAINKMAYFPANGYMYAAAGEKLYRKSADSAVWALAVAAFASDITDLYVLGDTLLVGLGDSTNFQTMSSLEAFTAKAVPGRIFVNWNGLLYRAVGNDVYYTNDLSTWSSAIEVCPAGFLINGMQGQQDYLFCACDDGLYYVGFVDQVRSVTDWGQLNPTEKLGEGMVNWQGALYIPVAQGVIRYDAGNMLPVGPDLGEGLPLFRVGNIGALATQNNYLYCSVKATGGSSSVWAFNGQGWHHIATLPSADTLWITSIAYHRPKQRLYIGTNAGVIFYVAAIDSPTNIDIDAVTYTSTYGTLETDWIRGGLATVAKDFESVMLLGDDIDDDHPIRVYWKDDASTDWEYLGEITESGQELRWDDYTTRPNSKAIKLGLGLYAKSTLLYSGTPIIRAVRLKYHSMITDWWRWNMQIAVHDKQTMLDGTYNDYTTAQMIAHLDALAKQVAPVIFEDVDGTDYEVKVLDAIRSLDKSEMINGVLTNSYTYNVALEQVTQATYTP
jgi:hypothetical protein